MSLKIKLFAMTLTFLGMLPAVIASNLPSQSDLDRFRSTVERLHRAAAAASRLTDSIPESDRASAELEFNKSRDDFKSLRHSPSLKKFYKKIIKKAQLSLIGKYKTTRLQSPKDWMTYTTELLTFLSCWRRPPLDAIPEETDEDLRNERGWIKTDPHSSEENSTLPQFNPLKVLPPIPRCPDLTSSKKSTSSKKTPLVLPPIHK